MSSRTQANKSKSTENQKQVGTRTRTTTNKNKRQKLKSPERQPKAQGSKKQMARNVVEVGSFIYPVDPMTTVLEACPRQTHEAIEMTFKPVDVKIMEFQNTSDKLLPSYYYERMQSTPPSKGTSTSTTTTSNNNSNSKTK